MGIKKASAMLTMLALVMGVFVTTSVASAQTVTSFSDVPVSYDYHDAVSYLKDSGVVQGYGDNTYKPDNTINRAEFVKIALLSGGHQPEGSNCFPDVNEEWFSGYVCKAKALGLVQGYPDGTFKPERPINFVESGKIVGEGLNLEKDDTLLDTWYHKYVKALEADQAIPPTVDTFDQYINRGEMAEMIWRIQEETGGDSNNYNDLKDSTEAQNVYTITSCSVLQDKFESAGSNYYGYGEVTLMEAVDSAIAPTAAPAQKAADATTSGAVSTEGESYSTTNVQVEGVDEADIVKTDGEYIYIVKGDTVRVVRAHHPSEMEELDAIAFGDSGFTPTNMYVDGDKLVVIGNSYYSYPYPLARTDVEILPYPYYGGSLSKVFIFDISDKSNIKEFRSLKFEGNYHQSRKVDDMVYVVFNRPGFWAYPEVDAAEEILPRYQDTNDESAKPLVGCGDVKYIPAFESANYLIVVGIPINDSDAEIAREVILGSSENIYASRDNLYVSASDWNWDYRSSSESTNVYKFDLGRTDINFEGKGKVPGSILNQFSMDENDGHFRIATTKGNSWDDTSTNNVYVLDEDMNMTGKLEGIAPGESIHSTRFIGDRLYMVTFKKIDPFFVIDMADHSFPKILGKLKIPGYSDYLHPYDEDHIIGFGKEAVEATELEEISWDQNFAWYQGIKVAMFDVTDVENPKQMFNEVIGDRGTESPLLSDHKALLFDKTKNLLSFPVTVAEIPEAEKDPNMPANTYGEFVFQGAYVYTVDLVNGFNLEAKISHYDATEVADKSGYYWYGEKDIERVLYIGDFLYTVSKGMVKANDMTDSYQEVNSVEVAGGGDYYPVLY